MSDAMLDSDLPQFEMHGARHVAKLARNPELFIEQIGILERAVMSQPTLAIDIAKSMVETICKTILNDRKCVVDVNWDTPKLVKEALSCLSLVPDELQHKNEVQEGLKRIGGNLQGSVAGLCEVRNKQGMASHGRDAYDTSLDAIHAEFVARSADAIISFLYRCHSQNHREPRRMEFSEYADFNEHLNERSGLVFIYYDDDEGNAVGLDYEPSDVLFNVDINAYKTAMLAYKNRSEAEATSSGDS